MHPQSGGTRASRPSSNQSAAASRQGTPGLIGKLVEGRRRLFWVLTACTFGLDQLTKALLWHHPDEGLPPVDIIPHVLRIISHGGNEHGAFGLGPRQPLFYIAAAAVGTGAVVLFFLHTEPQKGLVHAALGMLAGGALGNMLDRMRPSGMVRDFIDLPWVRWPTFNLADTAICVGFALVFYDAFFAKGGKPASGPAAAGRGRGRAA